eukprot:gene6832-7600_t
MTTRWLPLESNPEFLVSLGVGTNWQFFDVFGLDSELLCMVPQPCCALLLLFPISENYKKFKEIEHNEIVAKGQTLSGNVYFMKQTVGNACGTVGIIHAIANNTEQIQLGDGFFKSFLETTKAMTPNERAEALESDEGISSAHEDSAKEGQTDAPTPDTEVNLHFIAFVHKDGGLYELDGRKDFPIHHGQTSEATFLQDAAKQCQKFMQRDSSLLQFNIVALSKAS